MNPGGIPFIEMGTTIVKDGHRLMAQKATANGPSLHFLMKKTKQFTGIILSISYI